VRIVHTIHLKDFYVRGRIADVIRSRVDFLNKLFEFDLRQAPVKLYKDGFDRIYLVSIPEERAIDLYACANKEGAFSEHQVAQIAKSLLENLLVLHNKGIVLKFLSPQHVNVIATLDKKKSVQNSYTKNS
jgi:hypothetical protein